MHFVCEHLSLVCQHLPLTRDFCVNVQTQALDRSRACPPEGPADNFKLFLGRGLERAELLFEEKNELCYKAPHPPPPPPPQH